MRKKELKLYLGIRWSNPDLQTIVQGTKTIIDELVQSPDGQTMPLNWCFSCYPFLQKDKSRSVNELIKLLKERIKVYGDYIVPLGYSGSPHHLLEEHELRAELEWTVSNPWQSGIKDNFDLIPHALIPFTPDLYRENLLSLYKLKGFTAVGLPYTPFFTSPVKIFDSLGQHEYITVFPYLPYSFKDNSELLSIIHRIISKDNPFLVLLLDIDTAYLSLAGAEQKKGSAGGKAAAVPGPVPGAPAANPKKRPLTLLLKKLHEQYDISFQSFTNKVIAAAPQKMLLKDFYPAYDLPHNAYWRNKGLEVMSLRRHKEASSELCHSVLKTYSCFSAIHGKQTEGIKDIKDIFPHDKRANVSSMHGHAALLSNQYSIHFLAGQICGLKVKDTLLIPDIPARSYLLINGKQQPYHPHNTFSIEGETIRGLRSTQILQLKESREWLNIDYFLVDDFPYLLATAYIRYPVLSPPARLEVTAPLEIPLLVLKKGEQVTICSLFQDSAPMNGTRLQVTQEAEPWQKVLLGSMFFIQKEQAGGSGTADKTRLPGIVFGYPPVKELSITTCPFKLERLAGTKDYLLKINPFGTWEPEQARLAEGREELFSFYVGTADRCPADIPHFPDYVLKEIPLSLMGNRKPLPVYELV